MFDTFCSEKATFIMMEVCGHTSCDYHVMPLLLLFLGYSTERLVNVVNSDLANTLGNILQRISSKKLHVGGPGLKYHKELFPLTSDPLINSLQNLPGMAHSKLHNREVLKY